MMSFPPGFSLRSFDTYKKLVILPVWFALWFAIDYSKTFRDYWQYFWGMTGSSLLLILYGFFPTQFHFAIWSVWGCFLVLLRFSLIFCRLVRPNWRSSILVFLLLACSCVCFAIFFEVWNPFPPVSEESDHKNFSE